MNTPSNPQEILALSRNFMECRLLLTGAEIDIFTRLAEPASSMDLAEKHGWHERPLTVLLDALTAMGLLIKKDGLYRTDSGLLPFLRSDSSRTVLPMIRHAATIWQSWSNLTRIVTETGGVESNGTLAAPAGIDWLCISPKGTAPVVQRSGHELKLVYPQSEDDAQPERFNNLQFEHFFLQPLDSPEREANTRLAVEYCLAHPQWKLSLQTHKVLGID